MSVENNSALQWFCFIPLCDWFRKLTPRFRPIRCKTIANRALVTRFFPALYADDLFSFWHFCLSWRAVVIAVIWNALSLPGSWRFLCALKHLEAKPRVKINLFRPKAPAHISHNCRPTYANTFSRSQYDSVRLNCDKSLKLKPGVQRIFCSLDDGGS